MAFGASLGLFHQVSTSGVPNGDIANILRIVLLIALCQVFVRNFAYNL